MSIFRGADLVGGLYPDRDRFNSDHAPVRYFVRRLSALRGTGGDPVEETNAAVGGAFDHEVTRQYATAPRGPFRFVFLGLGMNSGTVYGVHGRGPNAPYTLGVLRTAIQEIRASGARPILCNTIHAWPSRTTPESMAGSLIEGIAWPPEAETLSIQSRITLDAKAHSLTVSDPLFAEGPGRHLLPGGQLLVRTEGEQPVNKVLDIVAKTASQLMVRPGQIDRTGEFIALLQHWRPDVEAILPIPPSQQLYRRDWTGHGVAVDGLASFAFWNSELGKLAQEENLLLLDFEYRGFRWVERSGWDSIYTSTYAGKRFETSNHPQIAAQQVIYGGLMEHLAELYHGNALPAGHAILRGPAI